MRQHLKEHVTLLRIVEILVKKQVYGLLMPLPIIEQRPNVTVALSIPPRVREHALELRPIQNLMITVMADHLEAGEKKLSIFLTFSCFLDATVFN